ncbi:hypothetical protein TEA_012902 [Camellia sinensis var. sinensis]|uniref:Uncharacterized protein n=1 Tax=Camellia sinensis var. sinensis TaxID=542762 RepID=A0A4S4DRX9_CAMSN|nr:hypothetical protein TEA_012902 [Camellia sinensis var. sinensis]
MGSHGTLARRAVQTETPIMVLIQEVIRGAKDALSLAQGVVYWQPPKPALDKVKELVWEPSVSRYGADEGLPELREALVRKLSNRDSYRKSKWSCTESRIESNRESFPVNSSSNEVERGQTWPRRQAIKLACKAYMIRVMFPRRRKAATEK